MKLFINNIFLVMLLTGCVWTAQANSPEATPKAAQPAAEEKPSQTAEQMEGTALDQLINGLKEWDQALESLTTDFKQTSSYDGVVISRSQGKLYYQQEGNLLRLDTVNADGGVEQSAVTNKKILHILDEEGKNITTGTWKNWVNGQPNKALFDFGNYSALIASHEASLFSQDKKRAILLLTPKNGGDYKLYLLLNPQDYFPQSIIIEADLMKTQADLSNTVKNKPISKHLFKEVVKK